MSFTSTTPASPRRVRMRIVLAGSLLLMAFLLGLVGLMPWFGWRAALGPITLAGQIVVNGTGSQGLTYFSAPPALGFPREGFVLRQGNWTWTATVFDISSRELWGFTSLVLLGIAAATLLSIRWIRQGSI